MKKFDFFAELKRRNLIRVAAFYGGVSWLLAQIATQILPVFNVSQAALRIVVVILVALFPFVMLFAWFFELTPEGIRRQSEVAPGASITRTTGKRLDKLIIGVLTLAVLVLLLNQFVLHRFMGEAESVPVRVLKSIAVMPLINSTGDPANEYFSDGVSEELISHLARLGDLKVIGRTSSFQFKTSHEDSRSIGLKLGVAYLLEGSVRRAANRVRINVALVKSEDGANVWAETYDRELKDIFGVQTEIAAAVANHLEVTLLADPRPESATSLAPADRNLDAYNAFLEGNYATNANNEAGFRKAIEDYKRAIKLDPDYAMAWARLSVATTHLVRLFGSPTSPEGAANLLESRRAAANALRLDPMLSEAHRAQGLILTSFDFDVVAAEVEYRRALELAPGHPGPMLELGNLAAVQGRLAESAVYMQRVIAIDPLLVSAHFNLGIFLAPIGRFDEAEAGIRRAMELQPQGAQAHARLAIIQILRGMTADAVATASAEPDPFWQTFGLALACYANGNQEKADAALKKLIDEADDAGSQIASVYALRKDPDAAFKWLDHAWATHDVGAADLQMDPFLAAYRDDPRFMAFARKVGVLRSAKPTNGA